MTITTVISRQRTVAPVVKNFMAKYKLSSVEIKTSQSGKTYKTCLAVNQENQGALTASIWPDSEIYPLAVDGAEVEAELATKGKYHNLVGKLNPPKFMARTGIAQAQERKAGFIKEAQDRKETSIAFFSSTNAAINLIAKYDVPAMTNDEVMGFITKWRNWFLDEHKKYQNPVSE